MESIKILHSCLPFPIRSFVALSVFLAFGSFAKVLGGNPTDVGKHSRERERSRVRIFEVSEVQYQRITDDARSRLTYDVVLWSV